MLVAELIEFNLSDGHAPPQTLSCYPNSITYPNHTITTDYIGQVFLSLINT